MNSTKLYKPIVKNGDYLFDSSIGFTRPVEIHFVRIEEFDIPDAYKVLVLSSESVLSPNRESLTSVVENASRYDLILCADDEIIDSCPNAMLFPYGSTWLNRGKLNHPDGLGYFDPEVHTFDKKDRSINDVSFLASWYDTDRQGYGIRKEVWDRQEEITIPIMFHTSRKSFLNAPNPLPTGEKEDLFYSMFHICIENQSVRHYFTEKLIDSFLTYTIPVYWGCPNIGSYFHTEGMILFDTVDELIPKLNELTYETYYDRLVFVEKNRKIAESYANFGERIFEVISTKL
tara:strand:+ start:127 stop:990 length:864 start_codon:yes stop_codon:yes gene_type:complete